MHHQVWFVSDDALPGGVEWAFVRQAGEAYLFVTRSAIGHKSGRCDVLTRAWECWWAAEAADIARGLRHFATAV
jgi:hypothetical protein